MERHTLADILLWPQHVIPYTLPHPSGPPSFVLLHNSPVGYPRVSYTYFPPATVASALRLAIEIGLEWGRLEGDG